MTEFPERFDLSELETLLPIFIFLLHFFDGDDFVGFGVDCFEDCTEGTVSQHFYDLIFLHLTNNYFSELNTQHRHVACNY